LVFSFTMKGSCGMVAKYKRVLVKISGEALAGEKGNGIDGSLLAQLAGELCEVVKLGVQIGIVVGGGNFWRGITGENKGMDRVTADQMGMLATVINALALRDAIEHKGFEASVLSALEISGVAERFSAHRAKELMGKGNVAIFAAGSGCPYFSTDTAAVLRAAEIGADLVMLAKNVDGVYTADPKKDPTATKFASLTFDEVLEKKLRATDLTAMTLCGECGMPMLLFSLEKGAILKAVCGESSGTVLQA